MERIVAERPRAVTVIGWVWLVVAALRLIDGVLGLLVWRVGGLEKGIPFLPLPASGVQVRTIGLDVFMRHGTAILAAQILVSAFVVYAAFELLRLRPRARQAFELFSWLGILFMASVAVLVFAWTAEVAHETPAQAREIRLFGGAAAAFVFLLAVAFFGGTIYLLRRPAVRAAFEAPSGPA